MYSFLFYVFACMHVCMSRARSTLEARRGQLDLLGTEPRSSERAVLSGLSGCALTSAPGLGTLLPLKDFIKSIILDQNPMAGQPKSVFFVPSSLFLSFLPLFPLYFLSIFKLLVSFPPRPMQKLLEHLLCARCFPQLWEYNGKTAFTVEELRYRKVTAGWVAVLGHAAKVTTSVSAVSVQRSSVFSTDDIWTSGQKTML